MTTKTLDDVMRQILNDPDIFYIRYSVFDDAEWVELGKEFRGGNLNNVINEIDQKINQLENESKSQGNDRKKRAFDEAIILAKALKNAINNKPHTLEQMFSTLDKFGLVKCNLPNMEDYGKVIENHNRSTVEQYFLSKIDRASGYQKRALKKTFEYVKELYAMKLDVLEIAFFIRKLNSLTQFMEVITDE
ncbi:MAG: hypothetical protein ACUVUQ_09625 [Thermodesulfovibrionales bacterium]